MEVKQFDFDKMPSEKLSDAVMRKYVHGEKAMLVRFDLKKGALIAEHSHPNEQITYIVSGSVKARVQGKERIVRKGEVLIIPPDVPHSFEALEDTVDFDLFSPPRQDWLEGKGS